MGWVAALLAATMLVACTDDGSPVEPTPSPATATAELSPSDPSLLGLQMAIVLAPTGVQPEAELSSVRATTEALAQRHADDISELRVVGANDASFVPDMVALLAAERYDVVCAVGPGSGDAVLAVAGQFPRARFCATPAAAEEVPPNVVLVDVRVEEGAYLAAVAAAAVFDDGQEPPAQVLAAGGYAVERRQQAFQNGLVAGGVAGGSPYLAVVDGEDEAAAAARAQLDAGVFVIATDAGAADATVHRLTREAGELVIRSTGDGSDEPGESVLLSIDQHLDVALETALERLVEGFEPGVASVGIADGAVSVTQGGSPGATAAIEAATSAAEAITAGDVDPDAPPDEP